MGVLEVLGRLLNGRVLARRGGAPGGLDFVLLLAGLCAFGTLSLDLVLPALPAISLDFGVGPAMVQSTVSAVFIGFCLGQLLSGMAADRLGRRVTALAGAALFTLASVACALAPTIELLLAARFTQGFGGSAGMIVARAVVRDCYDTRESARMYAMLTMIVSVAPLLGPIAGAYFLAVGGWRLAFQLLAAFGGIVFLVALFRLPETLSSQAKGEAGREGLAGTYYALARDARFRASASAAALVTSALFSYLIAAPSLLITTYGLTPTQFGWIYSANIVWVVGAMQMNRLLLKRREIRWITRRASLAAALLSILLFAATGYGIDSPAIVIGAMFAIFLAYGFLGSNLTASALAGQASRLGSAAALLGAGGFGAAGAASLILAALYDGTARPLAGMMAACLIASATILWRSTASQEDGVARRETAARQEP